MVFSIRQSLERQILSITGSGMVDYCAPRGDRGLFGPESASWKVHADFVPMIVGGASALMLQMLHPSALAGVWDFSDFRTDIMGRLRRTAQFVSGTTYGPTCTARAMIEHVTRIHRRVSGIDSTGKHYSASDPDLLCWVHVAEAVSFLAAYEKFVDRSTTTGFKDRYFSEMSNLAAMLGATHVPRSASDVESYLEGKRPHLCFDERTREVLFFLISARLPKLSLSVFRKFVIASAYDLLPSMAKQILPRQGISCHVVANHTLGVATPIARWALQRSAAKLAAGRMLP